MSQVLLYLTKARFYTEIALADTPFVMVNMDETKIQHDWVQGKGWTTCFPSNSVMTSCFKQKVNRGATRAQTTLLAMVASDDDLQRDLPQIMLPYDTTTAPLSGTAKEFFAAYQHPVAT